MERFNVEAVTVTRPGPNCARIVIDCGSKADTRIPILLTADRHWDNPKSDHKMQIKHLEWAKDRDALIIDVGDLFCAMQGKGDRRASKGDIRPEHDTPNYLGALSKTAAEFFSPYAKNFAALFSGNHECVSDDTYVLTKRGWVLAPEVVGADVIASMREDGTVQWDHPEKVHAYEHDGDMVAVNGRGASMLLTRNHRVAYLKQNTHKLAYRPAEELLRFNNVDIPVSASNPNSEFRASDDKIKLLAWMLTDGSMKSSRPTIYQSKEPYVSEIRALLTRMGLEFKERSRDRDITEICGVKLKKKPLTSYEFEIVSGFDELGLGLDRDRNIPAWVHELSERQVDVLLSTMIDGNGSRHKSAATSLMLYGERDHLEQVQALLCVNGYRASLASRQRNGKHSYWCLNITKRSRLNIVSSCVESVPYSGYVYCVTMPQGNFIARRDGKVFVTGNSSVVKHKEYDLTERLVHDLNREGSQAQKMGYSGFVQVQFKRGRASFCWTLYCAHGSGGGGPVTKGVIGTNRRAVFQPDADIIVTGHIHESWNVEINRERLTQSGHTYIDTQTHIQLPTYKEEYLSHEGWHTERGAPPKPLGAWALELQCHRYRKRESSYQTMRLT